MVSLARTRFRSLFLRNFSTILNPNTTTTLSSKQKTQAAISLLKSENDPEKIIQICRAASLTLESNLANVAFSIAVSKLSETGHSESVQSFIEELKSRTDSKTERFASKAMILYGRAGMLDHSIQTFKQMDVLCIPRTTKSLDALLRACILAGKHDEVINIFREFQKKYKISPDLDTYNTVIKALCDSGSSISVFAILDEMESKKCKPNASSYSTLLAALYREGKLDDVGKVLELMKKNDCEVGVSTYNVRIQSLCKVNKSSEAMALLEEMLSKDVKPDSVTYFHLIYGFCKEGDLDEAKRLFEEMGEKGFVPISSCYFTLASYLCQGGDFDGALKVCRECISKDWYPSYSTMKALINGLMSQSKVEEAREMVQKMKSKFPGNDHMWKEVDEALSQ